MVNQVREVLEAVKNVIVNGGYSCERFALKIKNRLGANV